MRILFVAAEVAPYVSVGGLSQVMLFLPRALIKHKCDVRIFTAKYGSMDQTNPTQKPWKLTTDMANLSVSTGISNKKAREIICNVKTYHKKSIDPQAYFLENREYYELRANVFGYKDDNVRFYLLCKGCLEWLYQKWQMKKKGIKDIWWPDLIHCHDWHSAYLIELARTNPRYKELLAKIPIILTVHNFAYQGNADFRYQDPQKRDKGETPLAPMLSPNLLKQNPLLRGLIYADAINTVSPTHAIEVLTQEYASGLEDTLIKVRGKLIGILNGLDITEFNPENDLIIKRNYNKNKFLKRRSENKIYLQKLFSLPQAINQPLIGSVGRICYQKGWNLLLEILPSLLRYYTDLQFVVLGNGDDDYRQKLLLLQKQFPKQIGLHLRANFRLPRYIFSGADMITMPSYFEPGGIVALEALRYGAVPIVRRTGGLNDAIQDFNPNTMQGNGFSFTEKEPLGLFAAIVEALSIYKQPLIWQKLVRNCLSYDFSWDHAAKKYHQWYFKVKEERRRALSETPHPAYQSSQFT